MTTAAAAGPLVSADEVVFSLPDPRRALARVSLAHELRRPRLVPFEQRAGRFELRFVRPPADRLEYLLAIEHRNGRPELVPDPGNTLHGDGPFGPKSVVEFPGYEPSGWVSDEDSQRGRGRGRVRELELGSNRLRTSVSALLWSARPTTAGRERTAGKGAHGWSLIRRWLARSQAPERLLPGLTSRARRRRCPPSSRVSCSSPGRSSSSGTPRPRTRSTWPCTSSRSWSGSAATSR